MRTHFDRLVFFASQVQQIRHVSDQGQALRRRALKGWQAKRLAATHADLLLHPTYKDAAHFFLNDLYGEKDFSQRDADLKRILPSMRRFLPDNALAAIADAVELDALSERLDARLAELVREPDVRRITNIAYANAYVRLVYDDLALSPPLDGRLRQIDLMRGIGMQLDKLVKQPMLGTLLKTMALPAQAAGLSELHIFLLRGFKAFKGLGGAKPFLDIIEARERAQHDAWIALDENAKRQL